MVRLRVLTDRWVFLYSMISSVFSAADTIRFSVGVEKTEEAGLPRYCSRWESCRIWMAAIFKKEICRLRSMATSPS